MAGIYLHIPFCKTRCIYCDFYSTTRSELKTRYVHALCHELGMRKEYLKGEPIETIYFGGGTPSQLEEADFKRIFETIRENYGMALKIQKLMDKEGKGEKLEAWDWWYYTEKLRKEKYRQRITFRYTI